MRALGLLLLCSGCCLSVGPEGIGAATNGGNNGTTGTTGNNGNNGGSGNSGPGTSGGNPGGQASGGSGTTTGSTGQFCFGLQPNTLDFQDTPINTTKTLSITLINACAAPVNGIEANTSGADANLFKVLDAPTAVAANSQSTVQISYSPLALEGQSSAVVIFVGADGEQAKLNLFGRALSSGLTITPNPIVFGFVSLQQTIVACTTGTNQSQVSITISDITSFENAGGAFALATADDSLPPNPFSLPITIPAGSSAKVCFALTPQIAQQYQGQASLVTDDPSGTDSMIQLTGWGGGPQIICTPTSIDFTPDAGIPIITVPVTCTNTGTAIPGINLTLEPPSAAPSPVFEASFDQITNPYPLGGLNPGENVQIDLTYSPSGQADRGTLSIQSNAGQGAPVEIPLLGYGN